jgi:hypothetical protein
MRAPLAGGPAVTLASGLNSPEAVAVDATSVYWAEAGSIAQVPLTGGFSVVLTPAAPTAFAGVDAAGVYWFDFNRGAWMAVPLTGGFANSIPGTMGSSVFSWAGAVVVAGTLYWPDQPNTAGHLLSVSTGGGNVTTLATLASGEYGQALATDTTSIYFTTYTSSGQGSVAKVPLGGGASTMLATGFARPYGIAVDAGFVYFTSEQGGTVQKVPTTGGAPAVLASGLLSPARLVADASALYWVNKGSGSASPDGSVMKLAK